MSVKKGRSAKRFSLSFFRRKPSDGRIEPVEPIVFADALGDAEGDFRALFGVLRLGFVHAHRLRVSVDGPRRGARDEISVSLAKSPRLEP